MQKITVKELFEGYADINIPRELNDLPAEPSVSLSEISIQTLLFVTDKINGDELPFDASVLPSAPLAILTSNSKKVIAANCPVIRVNKVREALSYALSNFYKINYNEVFFIGVTGSNGKTTTATLIYNILLQCGYKSGFIGTGKILSNGQILSNDTYSMTTPDPTTLYPSISRMLADGCKYIVMEVSSHGIALGKIAPIRFKYAIFTNLDDEHLDFHIDKNDYFQTKLRLFSMTEHGLFNLDDEYSRRAEKLVNCERSTFGIINPGDAYATEILANNLSGISFYYRTHNLIFKAKSKLIGAFNVYNVLAALKCVIDLGIKPCIAKKALETLESIDGRMETIDGNVKVVIDYAHTPFAFYNCLKTLKQTLIAKQKLIVVFGCGGNRDKFKRPIFGKYAELFADRIIITEDNSRNEDFSSIVKDIVSGMKSNEFKIIPDREYAIKYALASASTGDIVALIGKGHERYKINGNNYQAFDERKIIFETQKEHN
jgi:UDP-N-acetylmuramoyl-L-alanyl-D-glutamate--2,6-diaminopimelate ligase